MFIREIGLYNFGVFAGPETINPCTSLEGSQPVTIIGGINGAGKTTILEAVLLALYGKNSPAVKEFGHTYQDYIESYMRTGSHTEAWVELSIDVPLASQMINIRLHRQWQRKKNQWVENFWITRNNIADIFLAQNWAYYVEDLVPSGIAELFFFDGEKIKGLAEEETGESMKNAIFSVFGVDLVNKLIHDMERLIKRHEGYLYSPELKKEIHHLERSGQDLITGIQSTRQELAGINTRLERLLEKARQKEEKIMKSGGRWEDERQKLIASKETLKERLAQAKIDMITIAGSALPLVLVYPLLTELERQMKQDRSNKTAIEALPLLNEQGSEIIKLLENQGAEPGIVHRVKIMLEEKAKKLSELTSVISSVFISEFVLNQVEHLTLNKLKELSNKAATIMQENQNIENQLELVEHHLMVEIDSNSLEQELHEYKDIQKDITNLSIERRLISERLDEFNRNFNEIEKKHQKLLQQGLSQVESEEETARIIEYAMRTQKTMQLFRHKLIESKTFRLSRSMQEAFYYLAHKKSLIKQIEIDPQTLSIRLYDKSGNKIAKHRLAAGEKQMLAISLLWGLALSSGRILPVIIDTPLGRLDSSHRENFVNHYLPVASHQVIVLSTDTEITGKYYDLLRNYIGREYCLCYSDLTRSTVIKEGYLDIGSRKEDGYDRPANQTV